ncbi:transcriptional regulator [Telmatospirillum siberiense]|uniref:Transcriptional regulator n=1 Tax=Telmatospirillum siberiense TaxID=382514 RepID=A0A2N3PMA4_9PROT|nr:transcriptional regulator [Telmatospirillum siberiense]PKU21533.1 transcriptional regulator [Telmatospirillum siberiense]
MVRMNVTLSDALYEKLVAFSRESSQSKSEILRKAITLFALLQEGQDDGRKIALVDRHGQVTTEIISL